MSKVFNPDYMMDITDNEFQKIRDFVYHHCGINLTEKKRTLLVGRLQKFLKLNNYKSFNDYFDDLSADRSGKILDELVNRVSTNFTYFWREPDNLIHFREQAMPEICKELEASGERDLRVWCAAAASGQEPYMLNMLIRDFFGQRISGWKAGLLATDISQSALSKACKGVYPADSISDMPAQFRTKYFKKCSEAEVTVTDQIKKDIAYRRLNLMNPLPFKRSFHVIFCRNVMIYFDNQTRQDLVKRMYDFTAPGGYLYVGHSESLGRNECPYEYVMPAVYRKRKV